RRARRWSRQDSGRPDPLGEARVVFTVIASEAKQSSFTAAKLDCFVASLLAMTVNGGWLAQPSNECHAAIEHDGLPGHVVVAEHHQHGLRHFIRPPEPADRNVTRQIRSAA